MVVAKDWISLDRTLLVVVRAVTCDCSVVMSGCRKTKLITMVACTFARVSSWLYLLFSEVFDKGGEEKDRWGCLACVLPGMK